MIENKIQTLRKLEIEEKSLSFVKDMYWGKTLKSEKWIYFIIVIYLAMEEVEEGEKEEGK